jgi:hypothetical protein
MASGFGSAVGIVVFGWLALWLAVELTDREGSGSAAAPDPPEVDVSEPPSALQVAIEGCDTAGVEAELEKGGRQFAGGRFDLFDDGVTLGDAVRCGPEMAALLAGYEVLNHGGDPVLHAAVATGNQEIVAAVLDAGADVDAVDDAGDSPLLDAATSDEVWVVEQLLAAGADPNLPNDAGHTPLLRAVGVGRAEVVALLLAAGASPEAEGEVSVLDVLGAMAMGPSPELVDEEMLHRVGEVFGATEYQGDVPVGPFGTARPLFVAAVVGDAVMVQQLLDAGADPTAPGGAARRLPVDAARIMGHDDVVALLGG